LWWGIPELLRFALWMFQSAKRRNERQALRQVWLAPLKFVPFNAGPWLVYGPWSPVGGPSADA